MAHTNAAQLRTYATVNGMPGMILLPDSWSHLDGVTLLRTTANYTANTYSDAQWSQLETAGVVFLPAAGDRNGVTEYNVGTRGYYWSSTLYSSGFPYHMYFSSGTAPEMDHTHVSYGAAVRLARDLTVLP